MFPHSRVFLYLLAGCLSLHYGYSTVGASKGAGALLLESLTASTGTCPRPRGPRARPLPPLLRPGVFATGVDHCSWRRRKQVRFEGLGRRQGKFAFGSPETMTLHQRVLYTGSFLKANHVRREVHFPRERRHLSLGRKAMPVSRNNSGCTVGVVTKAFLRYPANAKTLTRRLVPAAA